MSAQMCKDPKKLIILYRAVTTYHRFDIVETVRFLFPRMKADEVIKDSTEFQSATHWWKWDLPDEEKNGLSSLYENEKIKLTRSFRIIQ